MGNENRLLNCTSATPSGCSHNSDVVVECYQSKFYGLTTFLLQAVVTAQRGGVYNYTGYKAVYSNTNSFSANDKYFAETRAETGTVGDHVAWPYPSNSGVPIIIYTQFSHMSMHAPKLCQGPHLPRGLPVAWSNPSNCSSAC